MQAPVLTRPQLLDREFVEDWARRYLGAWNAHDPDAVASLCTEDVVWTDPSLAAPTHGRAGVRAFVSATARTFPDFHVEESEPPLLSATEPRALSRYAISGTMLGDWEASNFAATRAHVSVAGIDEWTFRGELMCGYASYYDTVDLATAAVRTPRRGQRRRARADTPPARSSTRAAPPRSASMSAGLLGRAGWRLVKAGWKPGPAALMEGAALVSLTDFTFARWRDLPGAWLAGARLRRHWPRQDGAVGLMLWTQPWRRRSGSISIWQSEAKLEQFIRTPEHLTTMRRYHARMSGVATTWHTDHFDRADVLDEARRRLVATG